MFVIIIQYKQYECISLDRFRFRGNNYYQQFYAYTYIHTYIHINHGRKYIQECLKWTCIYFVIWFLPTHRRCAQFKTSFNMRIENEPKKITYVWDPTNRYRYRRKSRQTGIQNYFESHRICFVFFFIVSVHWIILSYEPIPMYDDML